MDTTKVLQIMTDICALGKNLDEMVNKNKPAKPSDIPEPGNAETDKRELLTSDKLYQIRYMTVNQIAAIYQYGKVPVRIADDPAAYYQLRYMTTGQLEALFGKGGKDDG